MDKSEKVESSECEKQGGREGKKRHGDNLGQKRAGMLERCRSGIWERGRAATGRRLEKNLKNFLENKQQQYTLITFKKINNNNIRKNLKSK